MTASSKYFNKSVSFLSKFILIWIKATTCTFILMWGEVSMCDTTLLTPHMLHWYWLKNDHCIELIVFLQLSLVQLLKLTLYQFSCVAAPSCNVRADPTEIADSFHSCDHSGIVA
jgi:hypothetical protein